MSAPRRVTLSLVSHTNVGKTTLARTLLRRDVGEVLDQAHVTDATERFVLYANERGEEVALADNPGFGDSVRLLRRLRGVPDPLAWLVGQVWDRFRDRALFCSQQAIRHVRDESDLVLYLVNAAEEPEAAGYLLPELELLAWVGRPVVLLLNQTGAPGTAAAREADGTRWRVFASGHEIVRDVLPLDAFTRCWVQEGTLLERIQPLLPDDRRDLVAALLAHWRATQRTTLRRSAETLATLLVAAAVDGEPIARGGGRRAVQRAADTLAARLVAGLAAANEGLISLHGLDGAAAQELRVELGDVAAPAPEPAVWERPFWGSVVGGALGGLVADVATGGLSLGGGALLGALLGAAGGRGLHMGMELVRGNEEPRATWSPAFLERLATDTVLRYLAVAHFGRGAGSFRVRDHPVFFREVSERTLRPEREALAFALRERNAPAAAHALERTLRSALLDLYPEAKETLAEGGDDR